MNTQLLLRVADQIEAKPELFDMRDFDCGTTACVAGWAARLNGTPYESRVPDGKGKTVCVLGEYIAENILDVPYEWFSPGDAIWAGCVTPLDFANRIRKIVSDHENTKS